MDRPAVTAAAFDIFRAAPGTLWCFLTVTCADGAEGVGEATLHRRETEVSDRAAELLPRLFGEAARPQLVPACGPLTPLSEATVASALSQALWDIEGRRLGKPVGRLLGTPRADRVAVYANVNRRTVDRSPDGFAASARAAVQAGHGSVKIAPFDEVDAQGRARGVPVLAPGIERIEAVRDAIGPDRDLLVDCHWRLTVPLAEEVLRQAARLGLYWVECPLPESPEAVPDLQRLRRIANASGVRLAGGERCVGVEGFEPYVAGAAYDVVMPDIKHVGSLEEMLRLAERLDGTGIGFSPHNPSGPVSHAASLQLCSVAPAMAKLEMQFDETPLFWALAAGALPVPVDGVSTLPEAAAGLGVALDRAVVEAHRVGGARYGQGLPSPAAPALSHPSRM